MKKREHEKGKMVAFISVFVLAIVGVSIFLSSANLNLTGNVIQETGCVAEGYVCGNTDGSGPEVSCEKEGLRWAGEENLDLSCDNSGMAGCCKQGITSYIYANGQIIAKVEN